MTTLAISFGFVTPVGLLFALAVVIPIAAFVASTRRAQRARTALGLDPFGGMHPAWTAGTITAVVVLLAVALAQPVLRTRATQHVRQDAEAFYVFDISRSMLAAAGRQDPTRIERAQRFGLRMRRRLPDLASGVASLTDRVLPHLFPTADEEVFTATVEQSIGVDKPSSRALDEVTTLFAAFDTMTRDTFFSTRVRNRVVVVLTDGESAPYDAPALRQALAEGSPMRFVVVVFGDADERVWFRGRAIPDYRPDPERDTTVRQFAAVTRAEVFSEDQLGEVVRASRAAAGSGPVEPVGTQLEVVPLGRWFVLASLLPLGFLVWRRNVV